MGSLSDPFPPLLYPATRRDDSIVDNYHGVLIPDPYRWLENLESPETKAFVEAQAEVTDSLLAECGEREKLRSEITSLFDHERYEAPFKRGGKYFYFHNSGLQSQSVLFVKSKLDSEPEVLLDPNVLSEDGTVALSIAAVSRKGKHLAYGLSSNGSDWITIRVMRIDDKKYESDTISWVKFSTVSWTLDGKGFFYSKYPAPKEWGNGDSGMETGINLNHQLYYHFLGTDQSEDLLCWEDPENPKYRFRATVTEDGKRPDLFGCALAHVGVMDMLRFHKFTIGHAWTSEFGCSDIEKEFQWLVRYSPLHNVKRPWKKAFDRSIQYPSTMLLTADHDDRVLPLHSFKLLATMQHILCSSMGESPQKNPIIARIDRKAGHGAGRPTQKMIEEAADRYGFVAKMMGLSWNL